VIAEEGLPSEVLVYQRFKEELSFEACGEEGMLIG